MMLFRKSKSKKSAPSSSTDTTTTSVTSSSSVETNAASAVDVLSHASKTAASSQTTTSKLSTASPVAVHTVKKGSICAAKLLAPIFSSNKENSVKLLSYTNGTSNTIDNLDEEDKKNPPAYDLMNFLTDLLYLNESAALHLLDNRFTNNLIHTYLANNVLLVIDNAAFFQSFYNEKAIQSIEKKSELEILYPHLFNVARRSYRQLMMSAQNQQSCNNAKSSQPNSILLTGPSGTGKSRRLKSLLHFYCSTVPVYKRFLCHDKIDAAFSIVSVFTCSKSAQSENASRCVNLVNVEFDSAGYVAAINFQALLLDSVRVVQNISRKVSNFNVFYNLWHGMDENSKKDYYLDSIAKIPFLSLSVDTLNESSTYAEAFRDFLLSMENLGFSKMEIESILKILAALLRLMIAGANDATMTSQAAFQKSEHVETAAQLLGLEVDLLTESIFGNITKDLTPNPTSNSSPLQSPSIKDTPLRSISVKTAGILRTKIERINIIDTSFDCKECLNAFISETYKELVNAILCLLNRNLVAPGSSPVHCISIIDPPGMQIPPDQDHNANFNDFTINYLNERFNAFFRKKCLQDTCELYRQEKMPVDFNEASIFENDSSIVDLVDKQSSHQILTASLEARSKEKRGIFWLLDEEAVFPAASDESFVDRIFAQHGSSNSCVSKNKKPSLFTIKHARGMYDVTYDASGWLKNTRPAPCVTNIIPMLQQAKNPNIAALFSKVKPTISSPVTLLGQSMESGGFWARKATILAKNVAYPTGGTFMESPALLSPIKNRSSCISAKLAADFLIELLNRSQKVFFVHSLAPSCNNHKMGPTKFDPHFVRCQLRENFFLEACRLEKIGYPESMNFVDFITRFSCLLAADKSDGNLSKSGNSKIEGVTDKETIETFISKLKNLSESSSYILNGFKLGQNERIFLKRPFYVWLEKNRLEKFTVLMTKLQALARMKLAIRRFEKRKVQFLAISCIQKNINIYIQVKAWSWWKLYSKVLPLINVNKTDEELRFKAEELDRLRAKLSKLEKTTLELRSNCETLENRLNGVQLQLDEERAACTLASESLQVENACRVKLERELLEARQHVQSGQLQNDRLRDQLAEYQALKSRLDEADDEIEDRASNSSKESTDDAATINSAASSTSKKDLIGGDAMSAAEVGKFMRGKIRDMRKRIEIQRQQLHTEKHEEVQKQLELRLEVENQIEEFRKENMDLTEALTLQKRRSQKLQDELQDLRLNHDDIIVKNSELEKKNKKFNYEMDLVKSECHSEKSSSTSLKGRVEVLEEENRRLKSDLKLNNEKLDGCKEKYEKLERQTLSGDHSNQEKLRQRNLELEKRCANLEAECEETVEEMELYRQKVAHLEMANSKMKMDESREREKHEDEIAEVRSNFKKKVISLEQQLEEEQTEKLRFQKQVRELEAKSRQANSISLFSPAENDKKCKTLRKHYKRTKAMLNDAQILIEHYQKSIPSKMSIKQLKNQIEESEASRLLVMKQKQNLESELIELKDELGSLMNFKNLAEERCVALMREKASLQALFGEQQYEMDKSVKKLQAQISHTNMDSNIFAHQLQRIAELEKEHETLSNKVAALSCSLERSELETLNNNKIFLLESKIREYESKTELDTLNKGRLEAAMARMKIEVESLQDQINATKSSRDKDADFCKQYQQRLAVCQEHLLSIQKKDVAFDQKLKEAMIKIESLEQENVALKSSENLASKRLENLQLNLMKSFDDDEDDMDISFALSSEDDDDDVDDDVTIKTNVTTRAQLTTNGHHSETAGKNGTISTSPVPSIRLSTIRE